MQIAATSVICNLALDFSPMKEVSPYPLKDVLDFDLQLTQVGNYLSGYSPGPMRARALAEHKTSYRVIVGTETCVL